MKPETILWIYIVLLVLGGLMGFFKAKSKMSLITSVVFGAVLSVCALGELRIQVAWGILSFLALIFVLGWPLEWVPIVLIVMPIAIPIVKAAGIDLIWFWVRAGDRPSRPASWLSAPAMRRSG